MKKIIVIFLIAFLLTGCVKDETFNRAKYGNEIYNIKSITRYSDSNYTLTLENGRRIEVHPMNCIFYNNINNKVEILDD